MELQLSVQELWLERAQKELKAYVSAAASSSSSGEQQVRT